MSKVIMEVIKCGLCKEEIEYAQRCRVYIKTKEPRSFQRVSKRPHIGRYKLISTAKSTEHISFARRLKRLRKIKELKNSFINESGVTRKHKEHLINQPEEKVEVKPSTEVRLQKIVDNSNSDHRIESEPLKSIVEDTVNSITSPTIKSDCKQTSEVEVNFASEYELEEKMNFPHFQSSFEEYIKPILSKNNSVKSSMDMNNALNKITSTPKLFKNGRSPMNPRNTDCETYYWLELPKSKQPELRKLGYQFDSLVAEVKHMKLPNPDWKIKIMVHKQEMVSVSFTKKISPEKVVTVNAKSLVCEITLDGKKVILWGSPVYIHSIKDLEIMLDIVNDIQLDSPMISYVKLP